MVSVTDDRAARVIRPKLMSNQFLHGFGLVLMVLNKVRHMIRGYETPRTFSSDQISRNIDYTQQVCDEWEAVLVDCMKTDHPFKGRDILEVGPGPDLGNGLVLIAKGAKSYTAIDKNNLIQQAQQQFYEKLLQSLKGFENYEGARSACEQFMAGEQSHIQFIHDPGFNLADLKPDTYDLVVSRAAIEHIENVEDFFKKIKGTIKKDQGCLAALIDGKTHTRFIRDMDPLNILRYSERTYDIFSFTGSPNRWRMMNYVSLLEKLGFRNVRTDPYEKVSDEYVQAVRNSLWQGFRNCADLETLVFWLVASC